MEGKEVEEAEGFVINSGAAEAGSTSRSTTAGLYGLVVPALGK